MKNCPNGCPDTKDKFCPECCYGIQEQFMFETQIVVNITYDTKPINEKHKTGRENFKKMLQDIANIMNNDISNIIMTELKALNPQFAEIRGGIPVDKNGHN